MHSDFLAAIMIIVQCVAELIGFYALFVIAAIGTFVVSENNAKWRNRGV